MEYEKFFAKIWKHGESVVITVPSNMTKFGGYAEGDEVIVMMKKKVK